MECREFEMSIRDYIQGDMKPEKIQEFLQHAKGCPDCYEELEITYSVMQGIRELDNEAGILEENMLSLETNIYYAEEKVHRWTFGRIIQYAIETAAFWSVLCMMWLQLRLWIIGLG